MERIIVHNKLVKYVKRSAFVTASCGMLVVSSCPVFAASETLGSMAALITDSFTNITKLITAVSYLAGLAFFISAILKFKEHKEMPAQMPIGKPISHMLIAAALVFMPSLISSLGYTAFTAPTT